MIITISGNAGSGKTTVAEIIAKKSGFKSYYMGGIRRKIAKEKGMTLEEYNRLGETDPSTDRDIDEYQKKLGEDEDNFVIQGRISFFFIPHSIKVYIHVDPKVGAQRIWKDLQKNPSARNEGRINSLEDVERSIEMRMRSDKIRYRKYYNIDVYDPKHYDLVIDSTNISPEKVAEKILDFVGKKRAKNR